MLNLPPFPFTAGLLQALSHCYYSLGEKVVHLFSVQFRREQNDFGQPPKIHIILKRLHLLSAKPIYHWVVFFIISDIIHLTPSC